MTGWNGVCRLMPVMLVLMTVPVMAQTVLAVDNGPPVLLEHSESNAAIPPQAIDPTWVPPREVVRMLRATGYSVLSRPKLRGPIFSVAVVTPRGDDGRLFLDARDGRLLRFVPGYALTGRTEEEIGLAYNPPSPPPAGAARKPQPSTSQPRMANRAPSATTGVVPSANTRAATPPSIARSTTAAPTVAPPQTQAAARPDTKPPEAKPALVIQPTQEMPPALGLE